MSLQIYFHSPELAYTGIELRPHFILSQFKIEGSCLAAFHGPCQVNTESLVDWEDRLNNDHISAKRMVHFLGEFFGISLREGVWIQRVLVSLVHDFLIARGVQVSRDGDDLFVNSQKLSVSIVTVSPVSVLLHLGINIDASGAPVSAIGLQDLGVDLLELTEAVLVKMKAEYESVERACVKVRPVF